MIEYTESFYENQSTESYSSAKEVLKVLFEYIQPRSILDLGCGLGTWLKACNELGINDFLGIDGNYVNKERLWISKEKFINKNLTKKLDLNRRFDMAISVEVAEHINANSSDIFIRNLTYHTDIVLFSAAIPYQGGTGHVNENWPEYWAIKFKEQGYTPIDFIRKKVWYNRDIAFWYKQNVMLYVKNSLVKSLGLESFSVNTLPLTIVHPEMYLWACMRKKRQPSSNYIRDKEYYVASCEAHIWDSQLPKTLDYGHQYQVRFNIYSTILRKIKTFIKHLVHQ